MVTDTIEYKNIEYGDRGTAQTIKTIREMAEKYSVDWSIISLAREIVANQPERDKHAEADALFYWVKQNIRFTNDPRVAELVQSPLVTLRDRHGDCDDFVILLSTLNLAIGNNVAYVTISRPNQAHFSHIFLAVLDQIDTPRFYDPSLPQSIPNWRLPDDETNRRRIWYDEKNYHELSGFFDFFEDIGEGIKDIVEDIGEEIGRFFDNVSGEIKRVIRNIEEEANRVALRIKKEKDRVLHNINETFKKWESDIGPMGKFLITGVVKMNIPFMLEMQPIMHMQKDNPFKMSSEEIKMAAQIIQLIGSVILSIVTWGSTSMLIAMSVSQLVSTAMSVVDTVDQINKRKELIRQLEQEIAKHNFEVRAKREAIEKLRRDIEILESILTKQKELEKTIAELELEYAEKIDNYKISAEGFIVRYRKFQVEHIYRYRYDKALMLRNELSSYLSNVIEKTNLNTVQRENSIKNSLIVIENKVKEMLR